MKCVSYKIQYGLGADGVYDLPRIAGDVADADVIALQEVDRFWARSGSVDSPAVPSEHLPDHYWVYGANLDMGATPCSPSNAASKTGAGPTSLIGGLAALQPIDPKI